MRPRPPATQPSATLTDLVEVAPYFYTARAPLGWVAAARAESILAGGQWWPKDASLTWCMGRRPTWVVEPPQVPSILAAREIALGLGADCGYSVGSAARAILKWIGPAQYHYKPALALTATTGNAYVECHPGQYADSTLWDCKSYYYHLLCRLPTWRLNLRRGSKLVLHGNFPGEEDRRVLALERVRDHKLLRNALVGCMCGRESGSQYFFRGERREHRGGPGLFRGAGLLIRRTAWELTRRAAIETDSKLSLTDCVLCLDGLYPGVWDAYGLPVATEWSGDAEVCAPMIFKVGSKPNHFYDRGSRFIDAVPRPAEPGHEYHLDWLRRAS